jgi:protein-S-isoprenylcysteine O-methyltransferase Ste14
MPTVKNQENITKGIINRFVQIAIFFSLQAVFLFLAAGRINWTWAWVFLGVSLVYVLINATFMLRTNPETVAERGRPKETKDWDKVVSGLWALAMYLALPIVAGLDIRFSWTGEFGIMWHLAGVLMFAVGGGIGGWAMITNAYFSTAVRIQTDRGHTVCRTGPYRFVRHPGYVGFILQSLGTPIIFGSLWALIPGFIAAVLMIIRTSLEDRTLQAELPGYPDYVDDVSYRLIPGLW